MMRMAVFMVLASITAAASAFGQDAPAPNDPAKAAFEQGKALFHDGKYVEAADTFREAYRLKPTWKLLYNVGQSEAAARRYGLALEAFERYLAEGGDEIEPARRDEVIAEVQRMRSMVASVSVEAPDGSAVLVEGVERGRAPLPGPLLVTAGVEQRIVVKAGDQVVLDRVVRLSGGQTMSLAAREPEVKPATPPQPLPDSGRGEQAPEPAQGGGVPNDEPSNGISPTWFWVSLGATAALAAGTIGMDVAVGNAKDEIVDKKTQDDALALRNGAIALFAITCAAAVTTGVLGFLVDWKGGGDGGSKDGAAKVAVDLNVGPGALGVQGRF